MMGKLLENIWSGNLQNKKGLTVYMQSVFKTYHHHLICQIKRTVQHKERRE